MQSMDDMALLREYAARNSEAAFEALVSRRIGFVYSAAMRQVRDPQLAEEIVQRVFTILAQKAGRLADRTILTGWLFKTTRFAALAQIRAELKRRSREQEVLMQNERETPAPDPLWEQMSPLLDEALATLGEKDRQAVLLRYFENKSLAEVGSSLGAGEDTARKRVSRALEKLHRFFSRRGVSSTTALIAGAISAHSIQAAPAMLAKSVAVVAVAKGAAAGGSTLILLKGAFKLMAWTQAKTAAVSVVIVSMAAVVVIQHQAQLKLRNENQSLRELVGNLQNTNARSSNPGAQASAAPALPDDRLNELLRLRGEVGVLRRQTNELGNLLANARGAQPRGVNPAAEQQPPTALPDDYPKTADGATKGIFEAWGRGDWNTFFTNFGEPGVPRSVYDQMFNDPVKSNYLAGMQVVSTGEPTNSFGPNMWWVPYKIRFADGTEREARLHVAQDPRTQRWFFKGGF
jgi:RNA polymerase sigma factor (sigma-70 family)